MKKLITIIITIASISVYAQKKIDENFIHGIGFLKIDKTTIADLYTHHDFTYEKIPTECQIEKKFTLFGVENFSYVTISDIRIWGLQLTFYNDTLIKITCSPNSILDKAFYIKYGIRSLGGGVYLYEKNYGYNYNIKYVFDNQISIFDTTLLNIISNCEQKIKRTNDSIKQINDEKDRIKWITIRLHIDSVHNINRIRQKQFDLKNDSIYKARLIKSDF